MTVEMSATAGPQASTSATATTASSILANAPGTSKDRIIVGSKAIVCQDADLRGEISIGSGCVLHPRCTIFAYAGPIILGDYCIVEENAVIVNRSKEPMTIGSYNLFEVGCRIEAQSIGSYNTFEPKSRVSSSLSIGDYCTIGAACIATADQTASAEDWAALDELGSKHLPDYTVVYGAANERRKWSGEGKVQQIALMHKHLAYLSETLPKYARLKLFT
ncbi:trimeric LpxA-like protein [Cystobasidium minutum MCA 4210]|uniref:trimeric LpxA-like protein n=1 Tax=Cystobasidium minutum MCA 4210 TaxID=1397322 RepID=UPI0034CFD41B|eukprot:jgi/Rhomi1/157878/estExt_Genewise1Plus.C_2_t20014